MELLDGEFVEGIEVTGNEAKEAAEEKASKKQAKRVLFAEHVARVVLQGFFDAPEGFMDMTKALNRRRAVRAVLRVLGES